MFGVVTCSMQTRYCKSLLLLTIRIPGGSVQLKYPVRLYHLGEPSTVDPRQPQHNAGCNPITLDRTSQRGDVRRARATSKHCCRPTGVAPLWAWQPLAPPYTLRRSASAGECSTFSKLGAADLQPRRDRHHPCSNRACKSATFLQGCSLAARSLSITFPSTRV